VTKCAHEAEYICIIVDTKNLQNCRHENHCLYPEYAGSLVVAPLLSRPATQTYSSPADIEMAEQAAFKSRDAAMAVIVEQNYAVIAQRRVGGLLIVSSRIVLA
jgi:hypothetical protein